MLLIGNEEKKEDHDTFYIFEDNILEDYIRDYEWFPAYVKS